MVSVLDFYSDDLSSNPAIKLNLKRTKINNKEAEVGPFLKDKLSVVGSHLFGLNLHQNSAR